MGPTERAKRRKSNFVAFAFRLGTFRSKRTFVPFRFRLFSSDKRVNYIVVYAAVDVRQLYYQHTPFLLQPLSRVPRAFSTRKYHYTCIVSYFVGAGRNEIYCYCI